MTRDPESAAAPPIDAETPPAAVAAGVPADALIGVARSRTFFPELESLRGIAVLLVFAFHVDRYVVFWAAQDGAPSPLTSFVRAGHTGVDLFFLLSGFLLGLPFVVDGLGGRRVSVRRYAARRALRILPLYWTAVLVATALTAKTLADLAGTIPHLLFTTGLVGTASTMHPYSDVWWSLVVEVHFYFVLPFLPLLLRTRPGRVVGVGVLATYATLYLAMIQGRLRMPTVPGQFTFMFSLFARGPLFLWGIAAAALYHLRGDQLRATLARSRWWRGGGADVVFATVVVALAFFLQWVVAIGAPRQMGHPDQPWHIVNGALWAAVLLLLLLAPLRAKRLFCNGVLARLGVLSYSIYIIHAPFMQYGLGWGRTLFPGLIGWNGRSAAFVAALALACYGLSMLTYRWIERPFLVRKSRFE